MEFSFNPFSMNMRLISVIYIPWLRYFLETTIKSFHFLSAKYSLKNFHSLPLVTIRTLSAFQKKYFIEILDMRSQSCYEIHSIFLRLRKYIASMCLGTRQRQKANIDFEKQTQKKQRSNFIVFIALPGSRVYLYICCFVNLGRGQFMHICFDRALRNHTAREPPNTKKAKK